MGKPVPSHILCTELVSRKLSACLAQLGSEPEQRGLKLQSPQPETIARIRADMMRRVQLCLVARSFGRCLGTASIRRLVLSWQGSSQLTAATFYNWQLRFPSVHSFRLSGASLETAYRLLASPVVYPSLRRLRLQLPPVTASVLREREARHIHSPDYHRLSDVRLERSPVGQPGELDLWRWLLEGLPRPASLRILHFGSCGEVWLQRERELLHPAFERLTGLRHLSSFVGTTWSARPENFRREMALPGPPLTGTSLAFDENESRPRDDLHQLRRLAIDVPAKANANFYAEVGATPLLNPELDRVKAVVGLSRHQAGAYSMRFWSRLSDALPRLATLRLHLYYESDMHYRAEELQLSSLSTVLEQMPSLRRLMLYSESAHYVSLALSRPPVELILLQLLEGGQAHLSVSGATASSLTEVRWSVDAKGACLWRFKLDGRRVTLPSQPLHGHCRIRLREIRDIF